jgi:flagellar hook protein FlgE
LSVFAVYSISRSALHAAGFALSTAAHNLANQQTDGFKQLRPVLQPGPTHSIRGLPVGTGVDVAGVEVDNRPGPLIQDGSQLRELSNTDIAGSLLDVMFAEQLFRINLAPIRAADQMFEELLNLRRAE